MSNLVPAGIERWKYREMGVAAVPSSQEIVATKVTAALPPGISQAEVLLRVEHAVREAEQRWTAEAERRNAERDEHIRELIASFSLQRSRYFRQVEGEVVHLALAIARRILHREAALDSTLLRGLVRVVLDRVREAEDVHIRLSPDQAESWSTRVTSSPELLGCKVIADETLTVGDCIIETDRGSVNCGIEEQMKEVEQSFSDLLARRPEPVA